MLARACPGSVVACKLFARVRGTEKQARSLAFGSLPSTMRGWDEWVILNILCED
jgi:hypothetical protein